MNRMAWTKGKTAAVTILAALLIGGGGAVVVYRIVGPPSQRRVIALPADANSSGPAVHDVTPAYPLVTGGNELTTPPGTAPASQPVDDAWPLYQLAIARVKEGYRNNIMCPAASPLAFNEYPPYPAAWHRTRSRATRRQKISRWSRSVWRRLGQRQRRGSGMSMSWF